MWQDHMCLLPAEKIDKCGDSQAPKKISTLNQNTAECKSVVLHLLELNLKVISIMSFLSSNGDVHIGDKS